MFLITKIYFIIKIDSADDINLLDILENNVVQYLVILVYSLDISLFLRLFLKREIENQWIIYIYFFFKYVLSIINTRLVVFDSLIYEEKNYQIRIKRIIIYSSLKAILGIEVE